MYEMFTEEEIYWIKLIEKDEKMLDKISDKRDLWITEKFIEFVKLIIKYENLRCLDNLETGKRLVRVHRNIPTVLLDYKKYEYIIFNGLYIVSDVMFFSPSVVEEFFKNPTGNKAKELGIPDNVAVSTLKIITDPSVNNEIGVGLLRSDLTKNYIDSPSRWSYPIF